MTHRRTPRWLLAAFVAGLPCVACACSPFVEEHVDRASATLRPHISALEHCEVSEASYRRIVSEWLRDRAAGPPLSSLSLGRAVAFPWLSRALADAALRSPGWAARVERARAGERDRLAAPLLSDPALLARLAVPFEGTPYAVQRVSFEKVLYGRADRYSSDRQAGAIKVPFDAQLWLRLVPAR